MPWQVALRPKSKGPFIFRTIETLKFKRLFIGIKTGRYKTKFPNSPSTARTAFRNGERVISSKFG